MARIVVAGIVGGIVMIFWGFVSHEVLKLSESSVRSIPAEPIVTTAMKLAVSQPGFYYFPGMDMTREPTDAEQKAWQEKFERGPNGVLVIHPNGSAFSFPRNMALELASNIAAALIAAWIVSLIGAGFAARAGAVAAMGLFSWLSISASYGIWYNFPGDFNQAELIDQVASWALAGLAIAAILRKPAPA